MGQCRNKPQIPLDYSALDHTAPVTADRPAGLTRVDWLWAFGIFSVASLVRLVIMGMMATANGYTLHSLFYRWDAEYYVSIARDGYFAITEPVVEVPVYERSLAFFPGFHTFCVDCMRCCTRSRGFTMKPLRMA